MAEAPDRQELLTALTTEHFTLQGAPLGIAAGVGGVAAIGSLIALLRYADRLLEERAGTTESLFPSPQ